MDVRHVSPSPGTVVVRSPVTGWERWRGRWTWHSRWRLRSYWAWWATHQSSLLEPGHRIRYTTCGSWLWTEHRSTARPMCHSEGEGGGGQAGEEQNKCRLKHAVILVVVQELVPISGAPPHHFKQLRSWHKPAGRLNCQNALRGRRKWAPAEWRKLHRQ